MKKLIKRNYDSTVKRGYITPSTTEKEFYHKMIEELMEFNEAKGEAKYIECADIILTCMNFLTHNNVDVMEVLRNKIQYNEQRTD